jgi:hypothetical protein
MITHVVLLQPKSNITEEQILLALEHVQSLQNAIPGIIDIQAGKNLNASNQGYTYGFVMHFADIEIYQNYAPHPAHQPVSQELQRLCEHIIDFDLASDESFHAG